VLARRYADDGARIPRSSRDCRALRRVIEHMRDCYTENLTLELMSSGVGLTPFQLIGLFKRSVGLTPHAYLTQVRLHAAMRELRAGASPTQAALAAGFFDQSNPPRIANKGSSAAVPSRRHPRQTARSA
jgi:AraC-like DNA-binding protein